jgi:hypothetical protein
LPPPYLSQAIYSLGFGPKGKVVKNCKAGIFPA